MTLKALIIINICNFFILHNKKGGNIPPSPFLSLSPSLSLKRVYISFPDFPPAQVSCGIITMAQEELIIN